MSAASASARVGLRDRDLRRRPGALCEVYQIDRDFLDLGREANDLALDRIVSWQRHPDGWGGPSADANGRPTIAEIAPLPWMFR